MTRLRLRFVCLLSVFAAAVALAAPFVSGARQPGQQQTRPRQVGRPAPAQSPAPSGPAAAVADESVGDDEVVKVDSLEVLLPVTVRDASGALVKNLSRTDFRVYEDGTEQPLSELQARQVPADVALLIDTSSSTADSFEDFRRAALEFASQLGAEDRVCLVKFDDRVELLQDWTRSQTQLRRALNRLAPGMYTRFNEALYLTAREQMKPTPSRRRALVILTDGIDSKRGRMEAAAALKALLESQAAVYVISNTEIARRRKQAELDTLLADDASSVYFNSLRIDALREGLRVLDASEQNLASLCATTGGRLHRPESFDALGDLYRGIAEELRQQYALYYRPLNKARDGSFRRVRVEVKTPGTQVTARVGYYAPR